MKYNNLIVFCLMLGLTYCSTNKNENAVERVKSNGIIIIKPNDNILESTNEVTKWMDKICYGDSNITYRLWHLGNTKNVPLEVTSITFNKFDETHKISYYNFKPKINKLKDGSIIILKDSLARFVLDSLQYLDKELKVFQNTANKVNFKSLPSTLNKSITYPNSKIFDNSVPQNMILEYIDSSFKVSLMFDVSASYNKNDTNVESFLFLINYFSVLVSNYSFKDVNLHKVMQVYDSKVY